MKSFIIIFISFILFSSILSYSKKDIKIVSKQSIITKEDVIAITNKDRLTILSFRIIKQLFNKYGATIICINEFDKKSEEEELISL